MPDFPRSQLPRIHELAARMLDSRKSATPSEQLVREMLVRFEDACTLAGLDRVLGELPAELEDDPAVRAALIAQLDAADLDAGGPRNAGPGKVADALLAALGLTLVDEADRTLAVDATVRGALTAAVTRVIEPALVPATLRDAIIGHARERLDASHAAAFEKIIAQLDDRGLRMIKQPKVPLDASQAIQRLLHGARDAVLGHAVSSALDAAKPVLGEAAARIDQPISLRMTPRDVLIARVCDERTSKVAATVIAVIVDGFAELAHLTWRAPETAARTYSPRETFAVGDVIDHPKFGRGTVASVLGQKMDVEFGEATYTLVHARG